MCAVVAGVPSEFGQVGVRLSAAGDCVPWWQRLTVATQKETTHHTPCDICFWPKQKGVRMRRSVLYCSHPQEQDKWKAPLALQPCPNPGCRRVGCLIRNGPLRGYGVGGQRVIRGQRVVCSARRRRGGVGCGKTFSILGGEALYRRQVSAPQLFAFFSGMLRGLSRRAAWRALGLIFSIRHAYRLWQAFLDHQLRVRELLSRLGPPPASAVAEPALQVIEHLQSAFAAAPCPLVAFQLHFQEGFLD
jgi:hypothetical protein